MHYNNNMIPTSTTPLQAAEGAPDGAGTVQWRSCCFTVNRDMITFLAQFFVSMTVLVFCLVQSTMTAGEARSTYISLATLVCGVWLPAPRPRTT